jgi:hypothetical protein
MTKIANSAVMMMAGLKRRCLWAALGTFSFLLAGQNAVAAWHAVTVPPPLHDKLWPLSTIPVGPSGVTLFARGTATGALYEGWETNGAWHFIPIFSMKNALVETASASYLAKSAPQLDVYNVVHTDSDGMVRLSSYSIFNGWTTQVVDNGTNTQVPLATVATLVFGGKLYIFYTSSNGVTDTLKVAVYDGKFVLQTLDGNGGPDGRIVSNMYQPSAVAAPDGLRVYYYDHSHGTLREAHSPDGVSWTKFDTVDGPGVNGGDPDAVGFLPAAIVYNNTVNVFYTDLTKQQLRMAQRAGGLWSYELVDNIDVQSYKAPVIHGNEMQVYYESAGQLRAAYGTGPKALALATLDGGEGGIPTGIAIGSVSDPMGFYATAVEVHGTAPSVFYWDTLNANVRNSYWQ